MTAHLRQARRAAVLLLLLTPLLPACRVTLDGPRPTPVPRPTASRAGEGRLPAFAGGRPEQRGWVQVRDLFWVRADEASHWQRGLVWDGAQWMDGAAAGPHPAAAASGYLVRTNHVALCTNVGWREAEHLAGQAQRHVEGLFGSFGDALDLRFPAGPLSVVVHRQRIEFRRALDAVAPGHHGWGAFYDASTGTVHVSTEPAPTGDLPLVADLRHEMTHQILDRSRPRPGRMPTQNLWLWEGFAVHAETLGDAPEEDTGHLRRVRFARRLARGEVTPLARLFRMSIRELEGRHYDQLGALFDFLMMDGVPNGRRATLETLNVLLRDAGTLAAFERRIGLGAPALEQAWLGGRERR